MLHTNWEKVKLKIKFARLPRYHILAMKQAEEAVSSDHIKQTINKSAALA